jgi:hypothetical protein
MSLRLPTVLLTVLALVVLEASLFTWDSSVQIVRGTLLCGSAPLSRLPLQIIATLGGCSRKGLLYELKEGQSQAYRP